MTRTLRWLTVIIFLASCTGCIPSGGGAKEIESQLQTYEDERTPDKLLARGRAFARVGDFTRAEQYLSAAIDAGSELRDALPLLLRVCIAEQRYRAAIAYATPHLEKAPDDFRLRFVIASLYVSIGDSSTAFDHLDKVLETAPNHAEAHFAMGMLSLKNEQDPVAADEHFREYLRLEPEGTHAAEAKSHLLRSMP